MSYHSPYYVAYMCFTSVLATSPAAGGLLIRLCFLEDTFRSGLCTRSGEPVQGNELYWYHRIIIIYFLRFLVECVLLFSWCSYFVCWSLATLWHSRYYVFSLCLISFDTTSFLYVLHQSLVRRLYLLPLSLLRRRRPAALPSHFVLTYINVVLVCVRVPANKSYATSAMAPNVTIVVSYECVLDMRCFGLLMSLLAIPR